jgi:hypothetical protein
MFVCGIIKKCKKQTKKEIRKLKIRKKRHFSGPFFLVVYSRNDDFNRFKDRKAKAEFQVTENLFAFYLFSLLPDFFASLSYLISTRREFHLKFCFDCQNVCKIPQNFHTTSNYISLSFEYERVDAVDDSSLCNNEKVFSTILSDFHIHNFHPRKRV